MTPAAKRAAAAVVFAALGAITGDLVLWPRSGVISGYAVVSGDFFNPALVARANHLQGANSWISLASLLLQMVVLGGLAATVRWRPRLDRLYARAAAVAALAGALVTAVGLPFAAVIFQRQRSDGLATQSWTSWLGDWLLAALLAILMVVLLGISLQWLVRRLRGVWWIGLAGLATAAAAAYLLLAPLLVDPLFGHFRDAPAPLRAQVDQLANRAGVDVGTIQIVDAGKRTTAVNAYVTGLGSTRRVVLYDTLVRLPRPELRIVVAHELGHAHYRDVWRGVLWMLIFSPFAAFAVDLIARPAQRPRASIRDGLIDIPAMLLGLAVVASIGVIISNALSRRVEARADTFALEVTGDPEAEISLEQRLTRLNLSRPVPPPLLHELFGTHPTPVERVGAAVEYRRRNLR